MSLSPSDESLARVIATLTRYARARVRSTRDASCFLGRRGIPPALAAQAVARCVRLGVLDDAACARLWAEHWARQGYALAAISQKLSAKGIDGQQAAAAINRVGLEASDEARARVLLATERRVGASARARVARRLASKGFDAELIEQLLSEFFGSIPSDAER